MFTLLLAATTPVGKASAAPVTLTPQQLQQMLQNQQALSYQHQSALQMHAPWLTHTLAGLFIIAAVALIGLLAVQTTKQEGLSGSIGGRVESALSRPPRRRRAAQTRDRSRRGRVRRDRDARFR